MVSVHGRTGRPGPNVWMARAEQGREPSMSLGFGPHLIYDGFGCPVSIGCWIRSPSAST